MKSFYGLIVLLLASGATLAQSTPRLMTIESATFEESGRGIGRLARTINVVLNSSPCHHRCGTIAKAIEDLEIEIADLKTSQRPRGDAEERLQRLKNELGRLRTESEARYRRYEDLWIKPLKAEINEKLKRYAQERNLIVVDRSESDSPVIYIAADVPDVTDEFIRYCNEEFERKRATK